MGYTPLSKQGGGEPPRFDTPMPQRAHGKRLQGSSQHEKRGKESRMVVAKASSFVERVNHAEKCRLWKFFSGLLFAGSYHPHMHSIREFEKKTKHWHAGSHWPFQEPKFGVPTIYSAYFLGLNFREFSQQNMAKHMVRLRSSNLLDPGDLPLRQWYVQSIIVHTGDFHLKMSYFHYPTLSNIESTLW